MFHSKHENLKNASLKVGFIALGCPKNLVDLQIMGAELHLAGFDVGAEPEDADAIIVNTCAFIEDAREESVSAIAGACRLKKHGKCRAVIVTGCLPQRYSAAIFKACPDVDAILGLDSLDRIAETVNLALSGASRTDNVIRGVPNRLFRSKIPEFVLTGGPYAYLKIGEGCSHACAFCAIPGIRGRLRSVMPEDIISEARTLISEGFRELDLVAQDVSAYGNDFKGGGINLAEVLRRLDAISGDFRIRLLYAYPAGITDELLSVIAGGKHICKYLDVPIQHSHPDILKKMRRSDTIPFIPGIAERIRAAVPGITLRTTCLVGFPGETEEHFAHLMDFVRRTKFDRLGVFVFSREEGTPAFDMEDEPDDITGEGRRKKLMSAQAKISKRLLEARIGLRERVLLEDRVEDEKDGVVWIGRTDGQAPEDIDGITYVLDAPDTARSGDFVWAEVLGAQKHDIVCGCI